MSEARVHRPSRRQLLAASGAATLAVSAAPAANAAAADAPHGPAAPRRPAYLPLRDVRLLPSPFLDNMRRTCAYLRFLDTDRLLHTFRLTVGLPSAAEPCGGWEAPDVQLRGHTTGHLLSALAQAHAQTGQPVYARQARRVVAALAECQAAGPAAGFNPGYLSAFPESVFDDLEAGGRPWAPYYTLHKIMAGLLDQYTLCGDRQAFEVLLGMAAWVDARTGALSYERMQQVLDVEFGGMNDVLASLYLITRDPAQLRTARRFDHEKLYGPLAAGRDELDGRHANTDIAKIVGAPQSHEATGDHRYLDIARTFWRTVTEHHSYAIGGNSNQEFFGPPDEIVSRLSDVTCENCNSYNMLKLGRRLFLYDPSDAGYQDHYEHTLLNQLLGEQDPDSAHGFVTYYTGLFPGSGRRPKGGLDADPGTYSSDYDTFSCDHGTGLETHTKFADTLYCATADTLWVNQYVPSEAHWREREVTLRQEAGQDGTVRLTVTKGAGRFTLRVRIPGWLRHSRRSARVRVAGRRAGRAEPGGYLALDRAWRTGDTVELDFPREPVWHPAPDNPQLRSLHHGPYVLAGRYGDTTPRSVPLARPASLRPAEDTPGDFTLEADGTTLDLAPFHRVQHENYTVYWAVAPTHRTPGTVARYPLDEGHGDTAPEAGHRFPAATLADGAAWSDDGPGGAPAVALDGTGAHVALAPGLVTGLDRLTVAVRVRVDTLAASARVLDLGFHKDTYLYLAAVTGGGYARAALKLAGMEAEDVIDAPGPLPTGAWTHVALTLDGPARTGVLYVNGAPAGRNEDMAAGPLLLGATSRNYLGRSQNSTHPLLHGAVTGFRLLGSALSAAEVAALART